MDKLTTKNTDELVARLKVRFERNHHRHQNLEWKQVEHSLENKITFLSSLFQMESSGGEPDVVLLEGKVYFCDCSKETPLGRRSLCYDREALESRKENKPKDSAIEVSKEMGIELLDEEQYRLLQKLEHFDLKTSSWLKTPESIRSLGGAIFGDFRFGRVFIYHNGAASYYAARGFRGLFPLDIN